MYGRYRVVICTFAGLSLVYAALASLSVVHLTKDSEIFPFFSWSLFSSPSRTFYQIVASVEEADVDAGPWPNGWLPQGNEFLWLPADAETKMARLNQTLRNMARDLSDGGDLSKALAKWRPHLDPFVPEGYSGYYVVGLDIIEFHRSNGGNRIGQTLGYFEVVR